MNPWEGIQSNEAIFFKVVKLGITKQFFNITIL